MAEAFAKTEQALQRSAWVQEIADFGRAASGGFIFATPLIYTLEMWQIGARAGPGLLLILLAVAFALNTALAYFAGFKRGTSIWDALSQAVEALAVGIVAGAAVLLILARISPADSLGSIAGQVVFQAVPISLGASAANIIVGRGDEGKSRTGDADQSPEGDDAPGGWHALLNDISATITGGVFLCLGIAPTVEISLLAAEMNYTHLLAIVVFSLLLSYGIVFTTGFSEESQEGPFQRPLTETALAYLLSLLVALAFLALFDHVTLDRSLQNVVAMTVVLGLPTTVGGAAGRLVI